MGVWIKEARQLPCESEQHRIKSSKKNTTEILCWLAVDSAMNFKNFKRHQSSPRFTYDSSPSGLDISPRRLSIQGNVARLTRSLSSLRLTSSKSSGEGWSLYGVVVDKEVLENILTAHYEDPNLKVPCH